MKGWRGILVKLHNKSECDIFVVEFAKRNGLSPYEIKDVETTESDPRFLPEYCFLSFIYYANSVVS